MTTLTHELLPLLPRYRHRAAGPLPWQVASPAAFKAVSKERIHTSRHRRMFKKSVQQGRRRVETGGVPSGVR